ncbi:hypothetical protein V3481_011889 [Fusarium oxysporum f. sp. vasinfectum]
MPTVFDFRQLNSHKTQYIFFPNPAITPLPSQTSRYAVPLVFVVHSWSKTWLAWSLPAVEHLHGLRQAYRLILHVVKPLSVRLLHEDLAAEGSLPDKGDVVLLIPRISNLHCQGMKVILTFIAIKSYYEIRDRVRHFGTEGLIRRLQASSDSRHRDGAAVLLLAVAIRRYRGSRIGSLTVDDLSVVSAGVGERVAFEVGCRKKIGAS